MSGLPPLAGKQRIVREQVARLENRMFQLSEALKEVEPEHAKKLLVALREARKLALRGDMDAVIKRLAASQYSEAVDQQKEVAGDLDRLLRLLLDELNERDEIEKEIKRLEEILKKLEEVIKEEKIERADSKAASDRDAAKRALEQAMAKLGALIRRQEQEVAATAGAMSGQKPMGGQQLAATQQDVRKDTEAASAQMGKLGQPDAQQNAEQAAEDMHRAEDKLDAAKLPTAKRDQEAALEKLKAALKQLEKRREELEKPADFPKMSEQQRGTENKTGDLAKQMSAGKPGQPGQPGEPGKQSAAPGKQQVEQAQKHMQQAAGKLDKKDPRPAGDEQDKALEQLEQAKEEVEEKLDQLRKEENAEMLAALEARFRAMLAKQEQINKGTTALDQKGVDHWKRADRLLVAKLSTDERGLAGEADKALEMLRDDGTSIVFPQVVEQLQEDMLSVAGYLRDGTVGRLTQEVETEIVRTLESLIDALEQLQKQGGGGGGGGGGEGGKPPLLPPSAELKLLKGLQIRVNNLTTAFDEIRAGRKDLTPDLRTQVTKVAQRQTRVGDMARDVLERVNEQP